MNLNQAMVDVLHEIRRIEPVRKTRRLNVPALELGNKLIHYYYGTRNLRTRELITDFMQFAGYGWLRKLVTRDTSMFEEVHHFATLDQYMVLAAANDPVKQWSGYVH